MVGFSCYMDIGYLYSMGYRRLGVGAWSICWRLPCLRDILYSRQRNHQDVDWPLHDAIFKIKRMKQTSQPPQMTVNSASEYFGITTDQVKSIDLWLLQSPE